MAYSFSFHGERGVVLHEALLISQLYAAYIHEFICLFTPNYPDGELVI